MHNQYIAVILLIVINIFNITIADELSFDEVCKIYTEAKNSNMSMEVASKYIFDNIKKRITSSDAIRTHEAVMSALGNKRYILFKDSAEHYLKRKWQCLAMKMMMEKRISDQN